MKSFRKLILIVIAFSMLLQTGCRKKEMLPDEIAAMLENRSGKVLRLGVYGDPMTLNPIVHIQSEHGRLVNSLVHAAPLRKMPDGTFQPYLFDSFFLFRGENGTVILEAVWKNNLKWPDGKPFDAKDLEFTIRSMQNQAIQSPYAELAAEVVNITSLDRGQRTRMVFSRNSRKLLELLTIGVLPSHILKDAPVGDLKKAAPQPENASFTWAVYGEKPLGMGPYMVKSRQKGSYLLLEPNPMFQDEAVASRPAILVKSSFDYQQLITDFRGGRLDWINLPSMLAQQLETMTIPDVRFVRYPNPSAMMWLFNNRRPALSDAKVRTALDLLVDRDMVKNLMPADGTPLFASPLASPAAALTYPQRVQEALRLLDEAGVKDGNGDGLRDYNGQTFKIDIVVNEDNLTRKVIADKLAEQLKKNGVQTEVVSVPWSELISDRLKKGEFDSTLISYNLPAHGNWTSLLHSSPELLDSLNFMGISDSELDSHLEKLDSMFAEDYSADSRQAVADYLYQKRPVAFLYKPYDVGLYHSQAGSSTALQPVWDDILNWKAVFGKADSQF